VNHAVPLKARLHAAHAFGWTLDYIGSLTFEQWHAVVEFLDELAQQQNNSSNVRVNLDPRAHLEFPPD
jgi:hypothetical protein